MKIHVLLSNFLGESKTFNGKYDLDYSFIEGDKIIATNQHVMLLIDKDLVPEYKEVAGVEDRTRPQVLRLLEGYKSYQAYSFAQCDIDKLKLKHNYPYKGLIEKKIPFCNRMIDFYYLIQLELIMLYYPGLWTVHFGKNKLGAIVFTNGKVRYIVMPRATD